MRARAALVEEAVGSGFDVEKFVENFEVLAEATGGVEHLRRLILGLAARGRLTGPGPTPSHLATDSQPFALPVGWRWRLLADCADIADGPFGSKLKTSHYVSEPGFRVLRLGNIGLGDFKTGDRSHVTAEHFQSLASYHLEAGDILVASLGNPSGRACSVPSDVLPAINKADCFRVRVTEPSVSTAYLVNVFNSDYALARAADLNRGDTRGRITLSHLRATPVPLPPLAEQKRIVAKVDQLMALCDELEARQTQKRETGARLTKSALEALTSAEGPEEFERAWTRVVENFGSLFERSASLACLRDALVEIAVSRWSTEGAATWGLVGDVVIDMDAGWSPKCVEAPRASDADWAILRTTAVQRARFLPEHHKKLPISLKPRPELQVESGTVLVTRAGPTARVGVACAVTTAPRRLMLSDKIIRMRLHKGVDPEFLALTLNAGRSQVHLKAAQSGMDLAQVNISQARLRATPIPMPPLPVQRSIVAKVEQLMKVCDDLEAKLRLAEDRAARLVEAVVKEMVA